MDCECNPTYEWRTKKKKQKKVTWIADTWLIVNSSQSSLTIREEERNKRNVDCRRRLICLFLHFDSLPLTTSSAQKNGNGWSQIVPHKAKHRRRKWIVEITIIPTFHIIFPFKIIRFGLKKETDYRSNFTSRFETERWRGVAKTERCEFQSERQGQTTRSDFEMQLNFKFIGCCEFDQRWKSHFLGWNVNEEKSNHRNSSDRWCTDKNLSKKKCKNRFLGKTTEGWNFSHWIKQHKDCGIKGIAP